MTIKKFIIIVFLSIFITFTILKLDTLKNDYIFNGSNLPGVIGKVINTDKVIKNSSIKGFLTYGPYLELSKGTYQFDILYSSKNSNSSKYDITINNGKDIIKNGDLEKTNSFGHILETLSIDKKQKIEVRIWYGGEGELSLHSIKIQKKFGYIEIKKYFKYFLILLIVNLILFYIYRYSKKITIFTLFLGIIIILSFIFEAYSNYYNYKEMTYKKMPLNKDIFIYYLNQTFKSERVKLKSPKLKEDDKIDSFYIMIDKKELKTLEADLPFSGINQYVDARLKINDKKSTKVKLRYRGGSAWNWKYDRKSIKIKFSKNDSYNMMKTINFSVLYSQDMFIEPITQQVASKVGALAPEVKTVRMFLNGEYIGLYLYLDQIDESFLRKNKLMPGSIYKGDYSLKKEWSDYIGSDGIAKLWFDDKLWDKKGARNAEQKSNREDIELFIKAVNTYNDSDFFIFADTYLSKEYYTYLALDVLWGTHHHDYFHNHKIYFDPYKGKYTAVSWDVRFWKSNKNKDNSYYPLIERLALNPLLELKRDKELFRILKIINIEYIDKLMKREKDIFMESFLADKKRRKIIINQKIFPWKETLNPPQLVVSTKKDLDNIFDEYSNNLKIRLEYLKNMLNDVKVQYSIKKEEDKIKILFLINGNSPVRIKYKNIILYPDREIINSNALKLDSAGYGKTQVQNIAKSYLLTVPIKDFNENMFNNGINAVTGKKIIFEKINYKNYSKIEVLNFKISRKKLKILKGNIEVNQTLIFDKYTTVKIEPNTTFIMDKNCSIYFYGKVEAIGTKEKPIKFIAKNKTKPWGLIAIQGQDTSGSKFEYCYFEDGSIDTHNLIHYTSQFNIHDTKDFEVRDCFIGENYIGDDSMHIAYSNGIVDNCTFDGARSDGLDIDISNVIITNNIFKNSENDGLDIMTTIMEASNNSFENMGDKGISVGEWSEANISNSTFINTIIGLEIKDKSKVIANNLTFINSKEKAINLYNKNKRYDTGGFLKATNIKFIGNNKVVADKKSKVIINE